MLPAIGRTVSRSLSSTHSAWATTKFLRHSARILPATSQHAHFATSNDDGKQNDGKLEKAKKLIQNRYKVFNDDDSEIIYDQTMDLDMILNQKRPKSKKTAVQQKRASQISNLRGVEGVFDIDELVAFLRDENLADIAVLSVPQEIEYCQFVVVCTAKSSRHIKVAAVTSSLSCLFSILFSLLLLLTPSPSVCAKKPNILILVADDLGYGDLSILGNNTLQTPNIDRIGRDGAVLSHHFTAASVCTPSRSAFLTGRYPVRSGMAASGRNRVFLFVAQSGGLPSREITFARSLQVAGYTTGLVGKWHLGKGENNSHHPNKHGFGYFYGTVMTNLKDFGNDGASVILTYFPQYYLVILLTAWLGLSIGLFVGVKRWRLTSGIIISIFIIVPVFLTLFQKNIKLLNAVLFRNFEVIEQPIMFDDLTDRIVSEAKFFMQNATQHGLPFLLVVNFLKVHTAHFISKEFNQRSLYGKYGDAVMEMDAAIGKIMNHLTEIGQQNQTFVYFTSDNGGHLEEVNLEGKREGGSNGIFRGGKGHGAKEGGIRVPTLAMWPGVIPAGLNVTTPTSQMDIFSTLHEIAGARPPKQEFDGTSIWPLLKGENYTGPQRVWFHYCGTTLHGLRWFEDDEHIWKVYFYTPKYKPGEEKCQFVCMCYGDYVNRHDPPLVFNLANDPREDRPLSSLSDEHSRITLRAKSFVLKHNGELRTKRVESQFTFWNSVWKPWLQPCCTFPFCRCTEDKKLTT